MGSSDERLVHDTMSCIKPGTGGPGDPGGSWGPGVALDPVVSWGPKGPVDRGPGGVGKGSWGLRGGGGGPQYRGIRRRRLGRNLCGFTDVMGVICRMRQGNFDIIKHAHVIYTKDQKSLFFVYFL